MLDYFQRCSYLNLNPVVLACHFQYRVEIFFKTIILDGILEKVKYHAIQIQFQLQGSPHILSFLQILDAPVLHKNNKDEYVRFVDSIVKEFVPNEVTDMELFQLVTTHHIHHITFTTLHSRSCCKYKSGKCRYHFGKFFTENTIVATPLPSDLSDEMKNSILSEHERILSKGKEYIDKNLDPKKRNILNPTKDDFEKVPEISEIIAEFNITEKEYYNALSTSGDPDFQITSKDNQMPVLLIIFSAKAYKHGTQILMFNLYSIIIKQ